MLKGASQSHLQYLRALRQGSYCQYWSQLTKTALRCIAKLNYVPRHLVKIPFNKCMIMTDIETGLLRPQVENCTDFYGVDFIGFV